MPRVEFEHTTPVFERAKTVHALARAATVVGKLHNYVDQIIKAEEEDETCLYCGVAPRGRSIERPLLINGYAYLAVSLPDNGRVASNS
jgi:hypothetical protein